MRWARSYGNGVSMESYTWLRLMPKKAPKREGYAQKRCEKCLHLGGDFVSVVVRPETDSFESDPGTEEW